MSGDAPKRRSFLQVHFFYGDYLKSLYERLPYLTSASFDEQIGALIQDGFSGIHLLAPYLNEELYDSHLIIANCEHAQLQWLRERNASGTLSADWIKAVAKLQIDTIKPDILYLSEPILLDSSFVRELTHKPKLVIGWRAAGIREGVDWSEFDLILSSMGRLLEAAKEIGARNTEKFYPGFPTWMYEAAKSTQADCDVVFCGQWTTRQHENRNQLLTAIAKEAQKPNADFSCRFFLSGNTENLPSAVKSVQQNARYGIEMLHAIRSGKIGFDARAKHRMVRDGKEQDIGGDETANMRLFEVTGSGACLITEHFKNIPTLFEIGREIETYKSKEELIDKLRYYSTHPYERDEMARRGWERCHKDHSMTARAEVFHEMIQRYLPEEKREEESPLEIAGVDKSNDENRPDQSSEQPQNSASAKESTEPTLETNGLHSHQELTMQNLNNSGELIPQIIALNTALEMLNSGDNESALQAFESLGGNASETSAISYGKAVALARLGREEESKQTLKKLLELIPTHAKAQVLFDELTGVHEVPSVAGTVSSMFQLSQPQRSPASSEPQQPSNPAPSLLNQLGSGQLSLSSPPSAGAAPAAAQEVKPPVNPFVVQPSTVTPATEAPSRPIPPFDPAPKPAASAEGETPYTELTSQSRAEAAPPAEAPPLQGQQQVSQQQVHDLVDQALQQLEQDNPGKAFELLIEAKRSHLAVQDLDYVRAICFLQKEMPRDAIQCLHEELRHFPSNDPAKELLAALIAQYPQERDPRLAEDQEFLTLLEQIRPYSMLPELRLYTLFSFAKTVCLEDLPGDFIECGVAGGGSTALLATTIKRYSKRPRKVFACDSYEGMPEPSEHDTLTGVSANASGWGAGTCAAPLESVLEVCKQLQVDDLVKPIKGYFEESLPPLKQELTSIALLHVDCDWYESTLTVLRELFDKVVANGFIQLDDYGYWEGVEKAVGVFQAERGLSFSIQSIDGMSAWLRKDS